MAGIDDLRTPLQPVEEHVLRAWARSTQERNLESLRGRQGPGGATLAPNAKTTIRLKGHDRVGFQHGGLAAGLMDPRAVSFRFDARSSTAFVAGALTSGIMKLNIFVKGQQNNVITKFKRDKYGKRKYDRTIRPVPARDFIGVDERDLDDAAEVALDEVLKTWGFA